MASRFSIELNKRILIFDGSMGATIQSMDLRIKGAYLGLANCVDVLVRSRPEVIQLLHESFRETGPRRRRIGRRFIKTNEASDHGWLRVHRCCTCPSCPGYLLGCVERHHRREGGCGLGLTLVKRFAEEAGGVVTCESDGDRGARFRVCLPAAGRTRAAHAESIS